MNREKMKKAIALKYEPSKHDAPHVIAKGKGYIADQILAQAEKHDVKIHEDQALIELLYQLEINEQIPASLYPIIAEIFALIYRAEQMAGRFNND